MSERNRAIQRKAAALPFRGAFSVRSRRTRATGHAAQRLRGHFPEEPRENAAGTGEKRLRAITVALNWAALRDIDLRARTESFEFLSPCEVEDLRDALRTNLRAAKGQKGKATVRSDHFVNRCHAVRDYLGLACRGRAPAHSGRRPAPGRGAPRPRPFREGDGCRPSERQVRGEDPVAPDAFTRMLAAAAPGSPDNPFQSQHQHRNYALLLLYHETGMRRGEALLLKGEESRPARAPAPP